jgi:hypothetical protein
MANKLPSFLDGARLVIKIDGKPFAFCEAMSFSDNMASQMTMGIGSYSPHTNEPLIYSAQASLRILRYTTAALGDKLKNDQQISQMKTKIDAVKSTGMTKDRSSDGNSMMMLNSFSPVKMLLESTFDVEVWTRVNTAGTKDALSSSATYVMRDCLVTDLSIRFNVGSLVSEDVSILCRMIEDQDERITKI